MLIKTVEYQWNGTLTKRNTTDLIVLHHAEASSCTPQQVHQWHLNNGWTGIGYHFFIRKDGSIYRGRPEWAIGAHAKGYNDHSIGICFEGKYMIEQMPDAQIKAGKELISYLKDEYGINNVKRHCDVNSTDCPGKNFPFDKLVDTATNIEILLPVLCNGMKNNAVATLQRILRERGYNDKNNVPLIVDYSFGTKTEFAVKQFQKDRKLDVDAIVGVNTWNKLLKD